MLPETLKTPALELFSLCAAAAALETLVGDERAARPFRALCALAASLCALRAVMPLIQ